MDFNFTELEQRAGGRFELVLALADRARKIKLGAPPMVDEAVVGSRNPLTIAMAELALGKITLRRTGDTL